MTFKNYRNESRIQWGQNLPDEVQLDREALTFGCILRIADGVEAMAKNYVQLQADAAYYKRRLEEEQAATKSLLRQRAALTGVITKLKKKV